MAVLNSIIYICTRALHFFLTFSALSRSLHCYPSAAQDNFHTIHLTQPPSPSYPSSTDIGHQHPSGHTVLIRSLHLLKPSQYSLISSTFQHPFYTALLRTSSFPTLSIRDTPTKLLKHFTSGTTFLLSALLRPHTSAPYNAVGTITLSHLSPSLYCSYFPVLPKLYTPHSFCVPHPVHSIHLLPLATPGT